MKNKILDILKNDSRLTPKEIASMLNVAEKKVKAEIAKLEKENVILKYSVIVNDEIVNGDDTVIAFIEVKVTPERDKGFDNIAKRLQKFPEVQSIYLMSGAYDLLVVVKGDSLKDIARFVSGKLSPLGNVLSTATHFLLKKYKENGIVMGQDEEKSQRLNITF
ncbi:MAG: Lrp/AsnC family transcriptional regulator [Candidatus Margulisbacteria bacterium]|nr:Lrp/AsnC family transcriptional regulator [Candidatus Margulisiibacteriota bacterium]